MSGKNEECVKVSSLKPGFTGVATVVKVVYIGPSRVLFSRRDQAEHRVADALVGDKTGSVLLTLWDDQIDRFSAGEVLEVRNGYTSLFGGSLRLNLGRYGTAEKVEADIGEVNTHNNLSEERHEERLWYEPSSRPFRRRRRR